MKSLWIILITNFLYADKYQLKDLQALDQSNRSEELLNHIYDIRPSERGAEWKELKIKHAQLFIEDLTAKKSISSPQLSLLKKIIIEISRAENQTLASKGMSLILQELFKCYKKNTKDKTCHELTEFVMAQQLNDLENLKFYSDNLYPLINKDLPNESYQPVKNILKQSFSEFICKKSTITQIVIDHLIQNEGELPQIHPLCLKNLKQALQDHYLIDNSDKWWKILNHYDLADNHLRLLLVLNTYLGENKPNESENDPNWESIKSLSNLPALRLQIIELLSSQKYYSDNIFTNWTSITEQKFLHIHKYFPEYWPKYLKACFDFYFGIKKYEGGNPTKNCLKLFNNTAAAETLDELEKIQMEGLKKRSPLE